MEDGGLSLMRGEPRRAEEEMLIHLSGGKSDRLTENIPFPAPALLEGGGRDIRNKTEPRKKGRVGRGVFKMW